MLAYPLRDIFPRDAGRRRVELICCALLWQLGAAGVFHMAKKQKLAMAALKCPARLVTHFLGSMAGDVS